MTTVPQNIVQEKLRMLRKQYADIKQKEKDNQHNCRQRALCGSASKRHMWLYADGIEKMNTRNRLQEEKMQEEFWDHSSCATSYTEPRSVTSSDRCDRMYRLGVEKIRARRERDQSLCTSSSVDSRSVSSSDRCDRLHRLGMERIRDRRERDQSSC